MKTKNQSGFTLIEAVIAIGVLSVGILALYSMQVTAINGNATANRLSIANAVANDCYERLWNTPYDSALLTNTNGAQSHLYGEFGAPTTPLELKIPPGVTGVTWGVTDWLPNDLIDNDHDGEIDEADEAGIKLVTLRVSYSDSHDAKVVSVTFYKI